MMSINIIHFKEKKTIAISSSVWKCIVDNIYQVLMDTNNYFPEVTLLGWLITNLHCGHVFLSGDLFCTHDNWCLFFGFYFIKIRVIRATLVENLEQSLERHLLSYIFNVLGGLHWSHLTASFDGHLSTAQDRQQWTPSHCGSWLYVFVSH